jgi:ferredoxin
MTTSIYYFSGTGNSMFIAKKLAGMFHADLLPIKDALREDEIILKADSVGIVFPVYNHRVPYIVKRFIDRISNMDSKYFFSVCTYGDSPCIALEYLSEQLWARGAKLSCGFGVKMPYNYISPLPGIAGLFQPFALKEIPEGQQLELFAKANQKLQMIYHAVCAQKSGYMEIEYQRLEHFVDFFNLRELLQKPVWLKISGYSGKCDLPYMESIQLMDVGFHCDGRCVRCGTCARICPAANIKMDVNGPV